MTDWRDLPPVSTPIDPPKRLRQTVLRHFDVCPRSGYLSVLHEGGPPSHPLERGSAFHEFAARATRLMIENGERLIPGEVAKDLMAEVVKQWHVPAHEQDGLRIMAFHFATGRAILPELVVAVERRFVLKVGEHTVSGTIDLASIDHDVAYVEDYKTTWALPSEDAFAGSFQVPLYALLLAFGTPEGEPFPIGDRVRQFHLRELYPRFLWDEGIASRQVTIDRSALTDHRLYLEGLVERWAAAVKTGKWAAIPGGHCSECPAPSECPLPQHFRPVVPEDAGSASELAVQWEFQARAVKAKWDSLRAYAKEHDGEIRLGSDLVLDFRTSESREVRDRDALARAAASGEPFNLDSHYKTRSSSTFRKRKLTDEEKTA